MNYKCAIFDMDGTLLESVNGIVDAGNLAFKELGFDFAHPYSKGKYFIGAGAVEFAKRAIAAANFPIEKEQEFLDIFLKNYAKTQLISSKPYSGIIELLLELKKAGWKICVATNKPEKLMHGILESLFKEVEFDLALAPNKDTPEKPDPFMINQICNRLNISRNECLYIGDSEYDLKTAKNAAIDCLIVRYGYGFYDQEWINGADYIVDTVDELKEKMLG